MKCRVDQREEDDRRGEEDDRRGVGAGKMRLIGSSQQ